MLGIIDIFAGFFVFILLDRILAWRLKRYDQASKRLIRMSFRFRMFLAVVYSLISAYYYKGGDTEMFLYGLKDMQTAVKSGSVGVLDVLLMDNSTDSDILSYYFEIDESIYPVDGFMKHASNFMVPKIGLIPYLLTNSYIVLCFLFSFFALAGAVRIYKLFVSYFPSMKAEIAIAVLFLPSVCYWSSGFLKDSLCFGALGFMLYAVYQLFIAKKKIIGSLIWLIVSAYMIYTIKAYILLALIPGIGFWLFGALGGSIKNKIQRRIIIIASLGVAAVATVYFIGFLTSEESLAKFSMDNLLESSENSREVFERRSGEGSSFQINTSNPALMFINGLGATFFRPFPWEITSFIVLFSAMEALVFLTLILVLLFKIGVIKFLRTIFDSPILILCFTFSIVFAVAVGISTTNFGSLSRYKIPCLPFYIMTIFAIYRIQKVAYPAWMQWVLRRI